MSDQRPVIVVGYDGSAAARAAVEEAIARTGRDGHLVIVHAYEAPHDFIGSRLAQRALDVHLDRASELMDSLPEAFPQLTEIDWESDVIAGRPADAICAAAEARGAREIIVGTHGHNPTRLILGGVALNVLHKAAVPVVVIPQRTLAARAIRDAAVGALG